MPIIGFGTAGIQKDKTVATVQEALNLGYRLIDTAAQYDNEKEVGAAIREANVSREELFITTKIPPGTKGYVERAVKERCEVLGVEYVDLCLIHWPPETGAGGGIWRELIEARRVGFCRSVGVSNYSYRKAAQLYDVSGVLPVVNQVEASPFGFDQQFLHESARADITVQAYSPLTRGDTLSDETAKAIAKKYDKTVPQVFIRWSLQKGMVPLPRSQRITHLRENYDVFDFELAEEDMAVLDKRNEHYNSST